LPRDLADVLHYFLPEIEPASAPPAPSAGVSSTATEPANPKRPDRSEFPPKPEAVPPLEILGIPMGDHDVVRAALTWNLAVETARLGGVAIVLAPADQPTSPLWPEPGVGPLGAELRLCSATSLADLHRAAADLAIERARKARRTGIVFVRIPTGWLETETASPLPFRWLLLLTSPKRRDLKDALGLAKTLLRQNEASEISVTIHGVRTIQEAQNAFARLDQAAARQLGVRLTSCGLLVDDLHVYRAIASQRPIGLAHPQAPATRALMDVARLLYEDARGRVLG
jgi:hypothetical protein